MSAQNVAALAQKIQENIERVIVGNGHAIELMLTAVLAIGLVLLEDVPGTGKTVMARSLARSLECRFSRIQFTPDLLPSDITGMSVYQPSSGEFVFKPGPVFTQILLADEINRATPRTQSALLECMEERQVTEEGVTRKLDAPFLVIATQNPIEIQGTFPLPEAQLDRFLMRLSLGLPSVDEATAILNRFRENNPLEELNAAAGRDEIVQAQKEILTCTVSEPIMRYIAALCDKTNHLDGIRLGVSPRGMLALMRASQAYAMIKGRDYVTPDDVKLLAEPVLAHRMIVRGAGQQKNAVSQLISDILHSLPAPTEEKGK